MTGTAVTMLVQMHCSALFLSHMWCSVPDCMRREFSVFSQYKMKSF